MAHPKGFEPLASAFGGSIFEAFQTPSNTLGQA